MTTEQKALRGSLLDTKYDELVKESPDDWYVVVDEHIFHASTPEELQAQLRTTGRSLSDYLIARMPGAPPYIAL
jgi:hypothetical protein